MTTVSIVTPWLNCPELMPDYYQAVSLADQVIIIDNGSAAELAQSLDTLAQNDKRFRIIHNAKNEGYAHANNQGLELVKSDIVVFLNNDIKGNPQWVEMLRKYAVRKHLHGTAVGNAFVDGVPVPYIEGWCVSGFADEIRNIGGWNDTDFPGLYYEDNEFCWRAIRSGMSLKVIRLPLQHLSNYTSSKTPGAYDHSKANREVFQEIVRRDRKVSRP